MPSSTPFRAGLKESNAGPATGPAACPKRRDRAVRTPERPGTRAPQRAPDLGAAGGGEFGGVGQHGTGQEGESFPVQPER